MGLQGSLLPAVHNKDVEGANNVEIAGAFMEGCCAIQDAPLMGEREGV
jgi:hypothetical protein